MKPARYLAASLLFLVVLAPALFAAAGGTGASSLSPALGDAPRGLVSVAFRAGHLTGIDGNVLLAIAKVECDYGRCRTGQPDDLVPDDVRARVDTAALLVVLPIPAPGWVQRIATPAWPADLAAHVAPSAVTNQCVAGALATGALMNVGDPRWNHLAFRFPTDRGRRAPAPPRRRARRGRRRAAAGRRP